MKISEKILEKWKTLRSEGDSEKIAIAASVSRATIQTALRTGNCNDKVFIAIAAFYQEKVNKLKQYL